ncbi:hypothetical protein NKG05_22775 [Oerskovia sp. M15]
MDDGWGAANGGTTGGAAASEENVYRAETWEELKAALGGTSARGDTTPRIVYVGGEIDAFAGTSCDAIAATVPVAGTGSRSRWTTTSQPSTRRVGHEPAAGSARGRARRSRRCAGEGHAAARRLERHDRGPERRRPHRRREPARA